MRSASARRTVLPDSAAPSGLAGLWASSDRGEKAGKQRTSELEPGLKSRRWGRDELRTRQSGSDVTLTPLPALVLSQHLYF